MRGCFYGRNIANRLNLYVHTNSITLNTALCTNSDSMMAQTVTWTNDIATNGCYYSSTYNIYIYPVADVEQARLENEFNSLINLLEENENVTFSNNMATVQTEWIYPATALNVDTGNAYVIDVNLNELADITIKDVGVK
jgi:hypothetical protein